MSKVKESSLWAWMKKGKTSDEIHLERVENRAGAGIPDVIGCFNGYTIMLELKTAERPARETTRVAIEIRDSQREWHQSWCNAHGNSFFLVQVGKERFLLPWDEWFGEPVTLADIRRISLTGGSCGQREVLNAMKGY